MGLSWQLTVRGGKIAPARILDRVSELNIEVDPAEAGLDKERLERIDAHFARYVADGRLAGWLLTVRRHGHLAHVARAGSRDLEAGLPVTDDTLWRIYSMTKPITSVAAMMLYEEGKLGLNDPVSDFIPAFADMRVYTGGSDASRSRCPRPSRSGSGTCSPTPPASPTASTAPPGRRPLPGGRLRVGHAARHGPGRGVRPLRQLPAAVPAGGRVELLGSTDVLGRVVEVASGQTLEEFFKAQDPGPARHDRHRLLGRPETASRLAALYQPGPGGQAKRLDAFGQAALKAPRVLSGGGGLVSTAADYDRFLQMLLDRPDSPAGELDGTRLLSPRTVAYMARNHLPGARTWRRSAARCTPSPRSAASASASASPSSSTRRRQGRLLARRAVLGRRRQHHVLDRRRSRPDRVVLHPAAAVQHLPDPPAAAPARLPGAN